MFIPRSMKMADAEAAYNFIDEFNFGVLVSQDLQATHLPFVLNREAGELYGHFARANPHWEKLDGREVLITFSGPHSYISPTWYGRAPAVPTWNYTAVHAYGHVSLLQAQQTLEVVEELVHKHEPDLLQERNLITDAYRDKLLAGVVGFKVVLSHVEGKLKLGQEKPSAEQAGVYAALSDGENLQGLALAQFMQRISLGTGK